MSIQKETQELLDMQKQLEEKGTEVARLEGEVNQLKTQMENSHGCATVKQAANKLKKSGQAIETMEAQYKEGVKELREGYAWG